MIKRVAANRVRELFSYEKETGVFTRKIGSRKCKAGSIATGTLSHGYIVMSVDGRLFAAHRLAWLWVHGEWPNNDIDHIDGDRRNNRLANLRDVSRSTNLENIKAAKRHNKSTGILGAYAHQGRFMSRIQVCGVPKYLGLFDTAEAAHAAYMAAKREFHKGNTL